MWWIHKPDILLKFITLKVVLDGTKKKDRIHLYQHEYIVSCHMFFSVRLIWITTAVTDISCNKVTGVMQRESSVYIGRVANLMSRDQEDGVLFMSPWNGAQLCFSSDTFKSCSVSASCNWLHSSGKCELSFSLSYYFTWSYSSNKAWLSWIGEMVLQL